MNYNLYVNISSIHPYTHIKQLNRTYCLMLTEKVLYKNITIQPFEHYSNDPRAKGIFVYKISGKSADKEHFFYDSIDKLERFLNYLTLYCNHGFMEMDNYLYTGEENHGNKVFDENRLPSVAPEAIYYEDRKADISECIKKSLKNTDDFQSSSSLYTRIDNALSLYRASFFQRSEGVRYILRFTALESILENQKSAFKNEVIEKIMNAARCVCKEERLSTDEITKICSHIGQLTRESIRNTIKNTLNKYHITIYGKEVDVDTLYRAKNRFGHKGVEVEKLHRLSIDMEQIIPQLINQLMSSSPN